MNLLSVLNRLSSLLQLGGPVVLALIVAWWLATWSHSVSPAAPATVATAMAVPTDAVPNDDVARTAAPVTTAAPEPAPPAPQIRNESKAVVLIGDRLTLAIYEQLAFDDEQKWTAKQHKRRNPVSFRQRIELSGEYEVQQDGMIAIPLLGTIAVADRTLGQVENDISAAFGRVLGRLAFLSVTIQHRPVFVLGPVKNPGTYRYSQGLTVLHLIALSGGFDRGNMDLNHMLDTLSGLERKQKAAATLERLLARLAVFTAEKDGGQPAASNRLIALSGNDNARKVIEAEAAARQFVLAGRRNNILALDAAESFTRSEIEDLKARLTHVESTIKHRSKRVAALSQLGDKISSPILNSAEAELSGVKERLAESAVAVKQAEARISRIAQERAQLINQAEADLASEILSIRAQVTDAEQSLSAHVRTTEFLNAATAAVQANGAAQMHYEIIKVSGKSSQAITASGTDLVQPGDLVRVSIAKPQSGIDPQVR